MSIKAKENYFTTQPNLWIGIHALAMKYRNMNKFQRLIFRIKARFCKPKLKYQDIMLSADCQTILENNSREDKSYNESIQEYFKENQMKSGQTVFVAYIENEIFERQIIKESTDLQFIKKWIEINSRNYDEPIFLDWYIV